VSEVRYHAVEPRERWLVQFHHNLSAKILSSLGLPRETRRPLRVWMSICASRRSATLFQIVVVGVGVSAISLVGSKLSPPPTRGPSSNHWSVRWINHLCRAAAWVRPLARRAIATSRRWSSTSCANALCRWSAQASPRLGEKEGLSGRTETSSPRWPLLWGRWTFLLEQTQDLARDAQTMHLPSRLSSRTAVQRCVRPRSKYGVRSVTLVGMPIRISLRGEIPPLHRPLSVSASVVRHRRFCFSRRTFLRSRCRCCRCHSSIRRDMRDPHQR
jgi:hypothetical protein